MPVSNGSITINVSTLRAQANAAAQAQGLTGAQINAYQHVYSSAFLAYCAAPTSGSAISATVGRSLAWGVSTLIEDIDTLKYLGRNNPGDPGERKDIFKDMWNNAVGLEIGRIISLNGATGQAALNQIADFCAQTVRGANPIAIVNHLTDSRVPATISVLPGPLIEYFRSPGPNYNAIRQLFPAGTRFAADFGSTWIAPTIGTATVDFPDGEASIQTASIDSDGLDFFLSGVALDDQRLVTSFEISQDGFFEYFETTDGTSITKSYYGATMVEVALSDTAVTDAIQAAGFDSSSAIEVTVELDGAGAVAYLVVVGADGGEQIRAFDGKPRRIEGGTSNDFVQAGSGNDLLIGGTGADTLNGGDGRDILNGFDDSDADTMDGQSGADIYYVAGGDTVNDTGTDDAQDFYNWSWGATFGDADGVYDYTYFWSSSSIPTEPLPDGALRLAADGIAATSPSTLTTPPSKIEDFIRAGLATMSFDETGNIKLVNPAEGTSTGLDFNWADGTIHLDAGREQLSRDGTAGADEIDGGSRADLIIGGDGADELDGKAGNDEVSGEGGDDAIEGGSGNDALYGDRGDDAVEGGSGNDRLWGGAGNDDLDGDSGDDMLSGNAGDDALNGGSGNDRMLGGTGDDLLTGHSGSDTFVFHAGDGADTITDLGHHGGRSSGRGRDLIEIDDDVAGFDAFADIVAAASQAGRDTVIDFGGGDMLTLRGVQLANLTADDFRFV